MLYRLTQRHLVIILFQERERPYLMTAQPRSNLAVPKLSVCADAQKVDRNKLLQTEFPIIEFDAETFQVLLDYLHSGCCPLSCISIPGKINRNEKKDIVLFES